MKRNDRVRKTELAPRLAILTAIVAGIFVGCSRRSTPAEENFSFTDVEKVVVDGSFFKIEIVGHSADSVETRVTMPENMRRRGVSVSHEKTGSTLNVSVERRKLSGGFLSWRQSRIVIKAPFDTELEVATSSGSISAEAIATRTIKLSASSGGIDVLNCDAALSVGTSSGKIVVDSCAGSKSLSSTSGGIVVRNSDGEIEADSSSGKQTYDKITGSISGTTSSGKIEVSDITGALGLRSASGGQYGEGVTLTGNSSFQTSSGSIDFDFANDMDDFTLNLESSSGKINAGATSARGVVVTGSGAIIIEGKSSSGRQTYR